jgi:hypothetical protein
MRPGIERSLYTVIVYHTHGYKSHDTPYDGFRCIDGGDLKINVVLLCGISRRLNVILIALYVFGHVYGCPRLIEPLNIFQ